jgi:hypothetical protein
MFVCVARVAWTEESTYPAWRSETVEVDSLPASAGEELSAEALKMLAKSNRPRLPYNTLTVGLKSADGMTWVGSRDGLMYRPGDEGPWKLFHSRRWLPDNHVEELSLDEDGNLWVKTPQGVARIYQEPTTLEAKMDRIAAKLRKRHVRHGQIGSIQLEDVNNPDAGWFQPSSDNDGLWTCLYIAAESFRYATTGDPEAKRNARESLDLLMFLEKVTGIPGFPARSVIPIEDDPKRYGGTWYRSADERWWWKSDTSSDEIDGHFFAYPVYYDLVADDKEKEEIRAVVKRITDHIIDHGYYLVGPTGKHTTWGVWAPERLNHDLDWLFERGLNSLELLTYLKVAEHIVGEPRYAELAGELIEKEAYATNTVRQKMIWPPQDVNHSDDELAFIVYYALLTHERDPRLRRIYRASIRRSWQIERPERSPLFNLIYAACLQADQHKDPSQRPAEAGIKPEVYDRDACLEWFRGVPEDLREWRVVNSGRRDLGRIVRNRFDKARGVHVLPVEERRLMRWNGDPYELDGGGNGREEDDGTFILLPYWMGRYHRLLGE